MLKDGWLVAMTSYRRNGRVVRDAMEDVNQLRQYIVDNWGAPTLCLLEGRSMGGCIATCLAENYPHLYNVCRPSCDTQLPRERLPSAQH